jgi:IMP dehydrogenase
MRKGISYDDVLLVPQYSDIRSRSEVDMSSELDENISLSLPIISSPMDTVTEGKMVTAMDAAGGLGVIHRYNTIEEQVAIINDVFKEYEGLEPNVGAAIGVSGDYIERATAVVDVGANIICVDVAHGHHVLMKEALINLKEVFGNSVHIMAGNVATLEGFNSLSDWGADSVRCNVGGGSICSTRIQTGHGVSGLQTIIDCARSDRDTKIIADGGLKNSGDIVKALAAGADFVMLGSLLAATDETPGFTIMNSSSESEYKHYRGMASKEAQMDWRGRTSSNEGVAALIKCKGPVGDVLRDLKNGIRSGFSYSGARTLLEFQCKARFIEQTQSSQIESSTHILR